MGRIPSEEEHRLMASLEIEPGDELWIVMRRADPKQEVTQDGLARYHIQGIATSEEIAVSMCRDEEYLIGPMPANVSMPHARVDWPGLYFPLKPPDV